MRFQMLLKRDLSLTVFVFVFFDICRIIKNKRKES